MGLAFLCSGQGGQHPRMFERLLAEPAARPVLDEVSAHVGIELAELPGRVTEEALAENRLAQLLVVGHALAACAALGELGIAPEVSAGYSVGEMSAHACAGAWDPGTTLDLARARAEFMDEAARVAGTPLGMTAVLGLPLAVAERLAGAHGCEVAIVNDPRHVVVGGPVDSLEALEVRAQELGATRLRSLPVRLASHTRFMAPAAPPFARALEAAPWQAPRCVLLSGLDGRGVSSHGDTVELLSRQLHEPLHWADCLQSVFEHGATVVLELGPGRALTKMVEEAHPHIPARAFDDFRSAAGAAAWVRRHV